MDKKINVYLDDERGIPDANGIWNDYDRLFNEPEDGTVWQVVRTVTECIALLKTGMVDILSLDHDLGECGGTDPDPTGYDVLLWLEEQIALHENLDVIPNKIQVHSDNASVWTKMRQAIESIYKKRDALLDQRGRTQS